MKRIAIALGALLALTLLILLYLVTRERFLHPTPPPVQEITSLTLTVYDDQSGGDRYSLAISVKDGKTVTMPLRFTDGLRVVEVQPDEARTMATSWLKSRAASVSMLSVLTQGDKPTMYIASPQARSP